MDSPLHFKKISFTVKEKKMEKICTRCKKLTDNFGVKNAQCRPCIAEKTRIWRQKNPEKQEKIKLRNRTEKKEYNAERNRNWRKRNPAHMLWLYAKDRAKKSNVEFSISESDIKIPETCPVFKIPIEISSTGKSGKSSDHSISLDRIDPKKGYTPDNIWVISWKANRIKNNATLEDLEKVTNSLKEAINGKRT